MSDPADSYIRPWEWDEQNGVTSWLVEWSEEEGTQHEIQFATYPDAYSWVQANLLPKPKF